MQRFGHGPENELALEASGDYTREIGYIKIANYSTQNSDNLLNNIWFQPEEIFPIDGTPEERQHAFWVPVDPHYFKLAQKLEVNIFLIPFYYYHIDNFLFFIFILVEHNTLTYMHSR